MSLNKNNKSNFIWLDRFNVKVAKLEKKQLKRDLEIEKLNEKITSYQNEINDMLINKLNSLENTKLGLHDLTDYTKSVKEKITTSTNFSKSKPSLKEEFNIIPKIKNNSLKYDTDILNIQSLNSNTNPTKTKSHVRSSSSNIKTLSIDKNSKDLKDKEFKKTIKSQQSDSNTFSLSNFANYKVIKELKITNKLPKTVLGERKSLIEKGVLKSNNPHILVNNQVSSIKKAEDSKTPPKIKKLIIKPDLDSRQNLLKDFSHQTESLIRIQVNKSNTTHENYKYLLEKVNIRSNSVGNSSNSLQFVDQSRSRENSELKNEVRNNKKHDKHEDKRQARNSQLNNKKFQRAQSTSPAFYTTEEKIIKVIKEASKTMKKPNKIALILATNKVVPISLRLKIAVNCEIVQKFYKLNFILNDLINFHNNRLNELRDKLSVYRSNQEVMNHIDSSFIPSRTVQVFLNLITVEDELEFKDEESETAQLICKIILIILNEPIVSTSKEFLNNIKPNYNVLLFRTMIRNNIHRLKDLIFYNLCGNIYIFPHMHFMIEKLVEENQEIFDLSHDILKSNSKICKILIYFILDFLKYANKKCNNGIFIYTLRLMKIEESSIRLKLKRLKNSLY